MRACPICGDIFRRQSRFDAHLAEHDRFVHRRELAGLAPIESTVPPMTREHVNTLTRDGRDGVPAGWRLVPAEATMEMIIEGWDIPWSVQDFWNRMLRVAPAFTADQP
ncbi:hypothetical protein [Sphingomonas oryzagri]|uniref:C2H2-type domain-containing protein n=1 Tax=Sphingomonas oryzagri TaxID=3042314 RepID=A0ABT6N7S9_9SPHN|nr:hypothetical protein [Sphingomonas oryzagri]MDH7641149.1 hypothetical protein [Sphingomonas oryzagri]